MPKREKHHYTGEPAPQPQMDMVQPVTHKRPYGVICYWEYREPENRRDQAWFLVESYGVDLDGYPTGKVQNRGEWSDDPIGDGEYHNWLTRKEPCEPPHQDEYIRGPMPGRAVTLWTTHGVELMGFNPPVDVSELKWLDYEFGKKLKTIHRWWELLEGGLKLLLGTERRAEDLMDAGWDFSKIPSLA